MNDLFSAFDEASFLNYWWWPRSSWCTILTRPAADDLCDFAGQHRMETREHEHVWQTSEIPRLTAWYGDTNRSYSFRELPKPSPMDPRIAESAGFTEWGMQGWVQQLLLNLYRTRKIASAGIRMQKKSWEGTQSSHRYLSAARTFHLRGLTTIKKIQFDLGHGSLLVMGGALQHFWQHSVNKSRVHVKQELISLSDKSNNHATIEVFWLVIYGTTTRSKTWRSNSS